MFNGTILESVNVLNLPTDPIRVAEMLDLYSTDWEATLAFLCNLARARGITIEHKEVIKILSEKYKE